MWQLLPGNGITALRVNTALPSQKIQHYFLGWTEVFLQQTPSAQKLLRPFDVCTPFPGLHAVMQIYKLKLFMCAKFKLLNY